MAYLKDLTKKDHEEEPQDKTRVFVVHGRNEQLRKSIFDFLRSIGLKPIEWSQAIQMTGETAPFIGEILDAAFKQAQAVVVLLNGDDEARLQQKYHTEKMPDYERNLTPQARPNVIFEAGLSLGRFPKRTIIVEIGELRPFSDIAGRYTIRMNNSSQARQNLAQRLSLAGCKTDLSGTDWHQVGNFEISITQQSNTESTGENIAALDEYQKRILKCLANTNYHSTFSSIIGNTHISGQLVNYHLRKLIEKQFVEKTFGVDLDHFLGDHKFKITKLGLDYFAKNNGFPGL